MHTIYSKDQNWWDFQAPPQLSWVGKYLCKVKEELKRTQIHTWDNNYAYVISKVYKLMTEGIPSVSWANGVWSRITLPKHKFIMLLSVQNKLRT